MLTKLFLRSHARNEKYRLNGIRPSTRLPNKHHLCGSFSNHVLYSAEQLPPKVDLRPNMTPVEDQSQIGSCTANALAGAYEYLTMKANGRITDVSRLFMYYNGRVKDEKTNDVTDSGCTMTGAIEALEEFGTCLETLWPYDISQVNTRPNDQAYQNAANHKITEALQVNINLDEMKSCLAQGFPFAFGIRLFSSFDKAGDGGVVPMPNPDDRVRDSHGSHALLAVGYSDQSQAFIVRNSWGANWGDNGYCYMPYGYLTSDEYCFDPWTVRKLANDDFGGQQGWDNNDSIDYRNIGNNTDDYGNNSTIEHVVEPDYSVPDNRGYPSNDPPWYDTDGTIIDSGTGDYPPYQYGNNEDVPLYNYPPQQDSGGDSIQRYLNSVGGNQIDYPFVDNSGSTGVPWQVNDNSGQFYDELYTGENNSFGHIGNPSNFAQVGNNNQYLDSNQFNEPFVSAENETYETNDNYGSTTYGQYSNNQYP